MTGRTLRAIRQLLAGSDRSSDHEQTAITPGSRPVYRAGEESAHGVDGATRPASFADPFWRVGRTLLGEGALPESAGDMPRQSSLVRAVMREAKEAEALATFARSLARGRALDEAHVATSRALIAVGARDLARSIAAGTPSKVAGHLGLGLVLASRPLPRLAWDQFSQVAEEVLAELVPVEAVETGLVVGTADSVAAAVRIGEHATAMATDVVVALAGRFLVTGHDELARALVEEAGWRPDEELASAADDDHSVGEVLDNLRRWTHPTGAPDPTPPGAVDFALFDYHLPDLSQASRNVGDYVQSLAMLGNLARFQDVRFTGAGGLGDLATALQPRVRPELRIDSGGAVHLRRVSRDYSEGDDIPPDTWMVAFGWHLHTLFGLRFGFPYHPNINPLFVSFHLNTVAALTPEAIEYLAAHGPVGCRDWTTVDLLLSAGVDAFFTGCLTTTIDAIYPDLTDIRREQPGVVAVIDTPGRNVTAYRPIERMTNSDPRYRAVDLAEGIALADGLLEDYQQRVHRIVTSRLHSYLPATSLGIPVNFTPRKWGDVRLDGLLDLTPEAPALTRIRDGIRALLASTLSLVLDRASKDEVYDHWRQTTEAFVAEARARRGAPLPADPESSGIDVDALVADLRRRATTHGPHHDVDPASVVDVAVALDQNLRAFLPPLLESLFANAGGPVRLWVLGRGLDAGYQQWISRAWPEAPMTFFDFAGVDYGSLAKKVKYVTVATMDRLLVPELLDEVGRVTYVDIDTVVEGDVCELASIDLHGYPLAARTSEFSMANEWRRIGTLLPAQEASDLRRTMSRRHAFDFTNFNAGVLVLDLARMRTDRFVAEHLPLVARFGLNDQDILNAYVGPNRVELDRKWNALPMFEDVTELGIIHYAGANKPWGDELVPYQDRWQRYADRVIARVGSPPDP